MKKKIYESPSLGTIKVENLASFALSGRDEEKIPAEDWGNETDVDGLEKDENDIFFGE